jgi:hypothetical protein
MANFEFFLDSDFEDHKAIGPKSKIIARRELQKAAENFSIANVDAIIAAPICFVNASQDWYTYFPH